MHSARSRWGGVAVQREAWRRGQAWCGRLGEKEEQGRGRGHTGWNGLACWAGLARLVYCSSWAMKGFGPKAALENRIHFFYLISIQMILIQIQMISKQN
jgi:hypothetical protein